MKSIRGAKLRSGTRFGIGLTIVSLLVPQPLRGDAKSGFRLLPIPRISLSKLEGGAAGERARAEKLVATLDEVEDSDLGLSTIVGARFFPPTDARARPSVLLELVKLGPIALKPLLMHLDDRTPTKAVVKREGIITWLQMSRGITDRGNPMNRVEREAVARVPLAAEEDLAEPYKIKVGDICFAVIGQIVGRGYVPVRYQPSGGLVVTSPIESPEIARTIRRIWGGANPRRRLLESLLLDYQTRALSGLPSPEWSTASSLQEKSAPRLLYYYPGESAPLICRRLHRLRCEDTTVIDKNGDPDLTSFAMREFANGVTTDSLLYSIVRCGVPCVKSALFSLFRRSTDSTIVLYTLPAVPKGRQTLVYPKLESMLSKSPEGSYIDYSILQGVAEYGGSGARSLFDRYLRIDSSQRRQSVILALSNAKPPWSFQYLVPMLDDRREIWHDWERSLRVCDDAALALSGLRPALKFKQSNSFESMDKQIAVMKETLGK
jgi:hypothetical protein